FPNPKRHRNILPLRQPPTPLRRRHERRRLQHLSEKQGSIPLRRSSACGWLSSHVLGYRE
ncbi:MAG: hypothetical protein Q9174_007121, partial [Haloplaca sp. 1 TL-2023]